MTIRTESATEISSYVSNNKIQPMTHLFELETKIRLNLRDYLLGAIRARQGDFSTPANARVDLIGPGEG